MLRLHYHPNSTFSRRIRIQIAEKGIEEQFQLEYVALEKLAHRSKDFLKMNPYGRVPVLELKDHCIYESAIIMNYLEDHFPEHPLRPSGSLKKAHMCMLIQLCDSEFAAHATPQIFARRFLPEVKWDQENLPNVQKKINRHIKILSKELNTQLYLLGNNFSLADLSYIPLLHFLYLLKIELPQNLQAWCDRLQERPSLQSNIPEK